MGWFREHIFPRGMDWILSSSHYEAQRRVVLPSVSGRTLEVGFGTGRNLPYYTERVSHLTAVDPNPGMRRLARKRIERCPVPVEFVQTGGGQLEFPSHSFDSVVSTWTLCSIRDLDRALMQLHRVLKPSGRFHFVEHGLSPDVRVARWQRRLNGLQKCFGDGCQLVVPIDTALQDAGFRLESCERFYLDSGPRTHTYTYRGIARTR